MSDTAPNAPVDAVAGEAAPAETNVDWESKYRAEVQDRIKERERYKPIAQAFGNLHPDDATAIQDFVRAYASGDTDTAVRWMVDNGRALAGEKFDQFITPAQQAAVTQQAQVEGAAANLTPDQVNQLVEERLQQYQFAQTQQHYERQIEATLVEHGYQPDSALATAAIVAASKRPDLDLGAAIREVEDDILTRASAIAARRADAAQSMGSPVVNGVAAINQNGQAMSPRDRALARLEANGI
jgi:hypothetical protein